MVVGESAVSMWARRGAGSAVVVMYVGESCEGGVGVVGVALCEQGERCGAVESGVEK